VDHLARKLLLAQTAREESLTNLTTSSLPALQAYVRGSGAYARGDYAVAEDFYAEAVRLDSTFALGALKLSMAAGRMADFDVQRRALAQAWRMRDGLGERDRAFLTAQLGPRYPSPSTLSEAVGAWNQAARLGPGRAEVWGGLAAALYEYERKHGDTSHREPMLDALAMALKLDPAYVQANVLQHYVRPQPPPSSALPSSAIAVRAAAPFLNWWNAVLLDSRTLSTFARDSFPAYGPANLRSVALVSQYALVRPTDGQRALELLLSKAEDASDAMGLLTALHSSALNRRDMPLALEVTRKMQRVSPAGRTHLRLRVLDAVYSGGDTAVAAEAAAQLAAAHDIDPTGANADVCVLAQWHAARGELGDAKRLIGELRAQPDIAPPAAGAQPAACADLVETALAVATRSTDAGSRLEHLDSLAFTGSGTGDFAAYANIALARLFLSRDESERALAAVQRRPWGANVWPRYLATSMQIERDLCAMPALAHACPGASAGPPQ
jgi:tetratricopeptide (TPR) repeat protein